MAVCVLPTKIIILFIISKTTNIWPELVKMSQLEVWTRDQLTALRHNKKTKTQPDLLTPTYHIFQTRTKTPSSRLLRLLYEVGIPHILMLCGETPYLSTPTDQSLKKQLYRPGN